jgi:hypothetical protein
MLLLTAAALSCTVVCAAALGALSPALAAAVVALAAIAGGLSVYESRTRPRAEPFSASRTPTVEAVVINARRVGDVSPTGHSDVA